MFACVKSCALIAYWLGLSKPPTRRMVRAAFFKGCRPMPPNNLSTAPYGRDGEVVYGLLHGAAIEDLPRFFSNHFSLDAAQLESGSTCCDLDSLRAEGVTVCRLRTVRSLHLRGALRSGGMALGFVIGADGIFSRDGRMRFGEVGHSFDWFLQPGETLLLVLLDGAVDRARLVARSSPIFPKAKKNRTFKIRS